MLYLAMTQIQQLQTWRKTSKTMSVSTNALAMEPALIVYACVKQVSLCFMAYSHVSFERSHLQSHIQFNVDSKFLLQ